MLTRDPCIVVSRLRPLFLAAAVLAVSCSSAGDAADADGDEPMGARAPDVGEGPPDDAIVADLDLWGGPALEFDQYAALRLGRSGDARVAWPLADLLRFVPSQTQQSDMIVAALTRLTGVFRLLHWGGVGLDGRSLEEARAGDGCLFCIPALDFPAVTDAAGGGWYADHRLVFGIVVNGEARAYPRHMMEVHELVNDEIGGRRVGILYCTLCASAQAYYTDRPPEGFETLELRTSGLLSRSNKVMFDLYTFSAFDTFTGRAVSGPLREAGVVLEQISVVTSSWGEWKAEHPHTTIVAEDGDSGRTYRDDPLRGRDDNGPIFPIGQVDRRLPVQERVLGVEVSDGPPVAFPVRAAGAALDAGREVRLGGVVVVASAGGLRATDEEGSSSPVTRRSGSRGASSSRRPCSGSRSGSAEPKGAVDLNWF